MAVEADLVFLLQEGGNTTLSSASAGTGTQTQSSADFGSGAGPLIMNNCYFLNVICRLKSQRRSLHFTQ